MALCMLFCKCRDLGNLNYILLFIAIVNIVINSIIFIIIIIIILIIFVICLSSGVSVLPLFARDLMACFPQCAASGYSSGRVLPFPDVFQPWYMPCFLAQPCEVASVWRGWPLRRPYGRSERARHLSRPRDEFPHGEACCTSGMPSLLSYTFRAT